MNKVSIKKWEMLRKDNVVEVPLGGLDGATMTVKRTLSFQEATSFVQGSVGLCITQDGKYRPEYRDLAVKIGLISAYANFNVPDDVNKLYDLIYNTDVTDRILEVIDREQFEGLCAAIDKKIEHEGRMMESYAVMETRRLTDHFAALARQMEMTFDGLDAEALGRALQSLSTLSEADERKFAHAVLAEREGEKPADPNKVIEFPKP